MSAETAMDTIGEEAHASRAVESKKPSVNGTDNGEFKADIVWINAIGIALMHLFAIYGVTQISEMKSYTLFWSFIVVHCAAMGISVGAHRLWTHRNYKAHFILRAILMLFNTTAMQNSIYVWTRDHRVHHKYTDTDADPHNINRGFFFAHVGWLMMKKHPDVTLKGSQIDLSDLKRDPIVMFQHKYYYYLVSLMGIFIPIFIPFYFWGENIYLASYANLMKYVLQLNGTWLINSGAHTWGYRPYDKNIEPTDSLTVNLLGTGEGFHNYHHCFPFDYRFEELRASPINFWARWIDIFSTIGLAYDLRTASGDMIRARVKRTGEGQIIHDSKEIEHDY